MIKDFFLGDQAYPEIGLVKAFLFFHGYGVANDDRAAFACCEAAAKKGLPCAQYLIGVMFASGRGTTQNTDMALDWFARAAESGHSLAAGAVSQLYEKKGDAPNSFKWALRAAELGSSEYGTAVGLCYQEGRGVDPNFQKALHWYRHASDMGDPAAMRLLGNIYEQGLGDIKADPNRGRELFRKAQEAEDLQQSIQFRFLRELALNGDRRAQRQLSAVYRNGWMGQPASEARADYWNHKSKELLIEP
jgi:TPR repeat protein